MRYHHLTTQTILAMLLFAATATVSKAAATFETLLSHFDRQPSVDHANAFFDLLDKEEFTDQKILFNKGTREDSLQQQVWYWAAEWLYSINQFKEAEKYALKALPKYHPANLERADCLNTLGCIYVRLGDFKQAANYSKQSLEMEMQGGDNDRISSSMNTLAGIYMAAYQPKEAEKYILQALQYAEKANNPSRKAILLGMASEIYHTLGNDTVALPYAEQAYEIEKQLDRQPKMMIRLSQKASALIGLHRYQEAEEALKVCIPALRQMGDLHSLAIDLNKMGMTLLCQERQREAIPYYQEAASLLSKMGDLYNEIHSHRGLYECYWKLNPDSAKIELDYFDLLKDSLYTHSTAETLSRYNAEFGNDQLLQENEAVRSAHQQTIIVGIIILLMVIALAWVMVVNTRRREKRRIEALMHEISLLRAKQDNADTETCHDSTNEQAAGEEPQEQPEPAAQVPDEDRKFLMRIIEVVNDGFATRQLGVEHIASELNMSVQTFRRRLMSAAGESPKAFISAIQMEKAGKLLADQPDMPIVDVASKCGFDEASSFTHTFKRIYGITPSQYREKH